MLMDLLSLTIVHNFQTSRDTSLQSEVFELHSRGHPFDQFALHCISGAVSADPHCAGLSPDDLFPLLDSPAPFAARAELYFALARRFPESASLSELLPALFSGLPRDSDLLLSFLRVFCDFARHGAPFLRPHLEAVVLCLCGICVAAEPPRVRVLAMHCFAAMVDGDPAMCRFAPEFYTHVTATLVRLISDVPDRFPLRDDDGDLPCVDAIAVAEYCFGESECPDFPGFVDALRRQAFAETALWPVRYAFLELYAALPNPLTVVLFGWDAEQLLEFAAPGNAPALRAAALKVLRFRIAHDGQFANVESAGQVVAVVQPWLSAEAVDEVRLQLLRLFEAVFALFARHPNPRLFEMRDAFDFAGAFAVAMRDSGNLRAVVLLISSMALFASAAGEAFAPLFPKLMLVYGELGQNPRLSHVLLSAIGQVCCNRAIVPLLRPNALEYLTHAWNQRSLPFGEAMDRTCLIFVSIMVDRPMEFITMMMNRLVVEATKELQFVDNEFCESVYTKAVSGTGAQFWTYSEDVAIVQRALVFICGLMQELAGGFATFLSKTIEIAKSWIQNPIGLAVLRMESWRILWTAQRLFPTTDISFVIVECAFAVDLRIDGPCRLHLPLQATRHALKYLLQTHSIDAELIGKVLYAQAELVNDLAEAKIRKYDQVGVFFERNNEGSRELDNFDHVLQLLADYFERYCREVPEIAQSLFANGFLHNCRQFLDNPGLFLVGCDFVSRIAVGLNMRSGGMALVSFLMDKVNIERSLFTEDVVCAMGRVLGYFPFSLEEEAIKDDISAWFGNLLAAALEKGDVAIVDAGLVAFSKFIRANRKNFNMHSEIGSWWACWPLDDAPVDSDAAFVLLLDIFQANEMALLGEDWLGDLLAPISRAGHLGQCCGDTGARICEHLRRWWSDPELGPRFALAVEALCTEFQEIMMTLLTCEHPEWKFTGKRSGHLMAGMR